MTVSMLGDSHARQLIEDVAVYLNDGLSAFIFDFTELKHMNSAGIGILITLLTRIRSRDGELVLTNVNETISNLLAITKLSSVFQIETSVDKAREKFIQIS